MHIPILKKLTDGSLDGIDSMITKLQQKYGPTFTGLPWGEQFRIAIQVMNSQRTTMQRWRFIVDTLVHLVPWIVALIALLHSK